jgi:sugar (pentulose or hexulose) kinase
VSASPPVVVGIDLGTSSIKGVALDPDARAVARARAAYPTARPEPGRAEQRPSDWLRALERVTAALARTVPPERWDAIGLSGMIPSLVLLDREGDAVGPALTWEDARAGDEAVALRRRVGAQKWYETTGQWVDGRYLLPMWRWTVRHRPDLAERAAAVVGAKDFLLRWLTGEIATDPSTATGFGCFDLHTGRWDAEVASAVGVGTSGPALPEILPSSDRLPLTRHAADALGLGRSIPVVVGAADSVLSADALGVVRSEDIAYVSGTSTVIVWFHDAFVTDRRHRYLVTPAARPGRWGLEMDLMSTGSATRWCASLLGLGSRGESRLFALAEEAEGTDDLVFLPYLAPGEQGALWDPELRGALTGLTLRHGPADVARALIDGIVLESRRCVEVLRNRGAPARIRATGPFVRSAWLRQRLADAAGCEVELAPAAEPAAAIGAAALCDEELAERLAASRRRGSISTPNPAVKEMWADRWRRHEGARTRAVADG